MVFYMRVTLEGKKANIKNRTKKPNNKRERFLELIEIELLRKEVASKEDFALELFVMYGS